jgi:hypothetical protein
LAGDFCEIVGFEQHRFVAWWLGKLHLTPPSFVIFAKEVSNDVV